MIVFLTGYMGCGKSSIGRRIARATGFRFLDMDHAIEERAGLSVPEIFEREGEAGFRRRESEMLDTLAGERGDIIVATGGGAPCFGDNMDRMNRIGLTVYFRMSPEKLASRLEHGQDKRPLLREIGREELPRFIAEGVTRREPFYMKASMVIDCDGVGNDYICRHLEDYINLSKR